MNKSQKIIVRMEWLDQFPAAETGLLRSSAEGQVFLPHFINGSQSIKKVCLPEVKYRVFKNAYITPTSSSVILNRKKILVERVAGFDQNKFIYTAGHLRSHGKETALVRMGAGIRLEKGIFLGGNGSFNYYHWVVEILPRLQFLSSLPEPLASYPLLVSEDVERIPQFKEILNLLLRDSNVIVLRKGQYLVDDLVYIDSPSNLPFNLREGEIYDPCYTQISVGSIRYIRDTIFPKVLPPEQQDVTYPKRIFLCRKNIRRNYNQDEVFNLLKKYGFEKVFMEDISIQEQVNKMHQAEWIVGPTGAAWTNLIFCQKEAKCLCWMAEESGDFSGYSTIAGLVGVDLRYITYKANVSSTKALYEKDFTVNVDLIEAGLYELDENIERSHKEEAAIEY